MRLHLEWSLTVRKMPPFRNIITFKSKSLIVLMCLLAFSGHACRISIMGHICIWTKKEKRLECSFIDLVAPLTECYGEVRVVFETGFIYLFIYVGGSLIGLRLNPKPDQPAILLKIERSRWPTCWKSDATILGEFRLLDQFRMLSKMKIFRIDGQPLRGSDVHRPNEFGF